MDMQTTDAGPAVLNDLVAAGLVNHEMIADPARLAGEDAALRALCALVSGTIYRLGAFHYAFRAGADDLGGRLGALPTGDWAGALQAALEAALGAECAWVNATGLLGGEGAGLDQPLLLLLQARETAVAAGLAAAPPGVRAVVDARYAVEAARLTAGGAPGSELDRRLEAIEARQAEILAVVLAREAAMADVLARLDTLANRPAEFETRLGLTLAEFLAQLERRSDPPAPARALGEG